MPECAAIYRMQATAVTDTVPAGEMLYELIEIRGTDAEIFLQGQLTQDVAALNAAGSLPAAWCNAKGRVITLLRLLAMPDSMPWSNPS